MTLKTIKLSVRACIAVVESCVPDPTGSCLLPPRAAANPSTAPSSPFMPGWAWTWQRAVAMNYEPGHAADPRERVMRHTAPAGPGQGRAGPAWGP